MLSLKSISHVFVNFLQLFLICLRTGACKKALKGFSEDKTNPRAKKATISSLALLQNARAVSGRLGSLIHSLLLAATPWRADGCALKNAWENLEQTWERGVRATSC